MQNNLNPQNYKRSVIEYLHRKGIEINKHKKITCPAHDDKSPSCLVYAERIVCPVCPDSWDIFDFHGVLTGELNFAEQLKQVAEIMGDYTEMIPVPTKETPQVKLVPVPTKRAKELFNASYFNWMGKNNDWGTVGGAWFYKNENNEVEVCDVRFDGVDKSGKPDKKIMSMFYNGKSVQSKNCPVVLFGRDRISQRPDLPVLIVEGAKTALASMAVPGFNIVTWNRGTNSLNKADWSPLAGKTVYIFPDDDTPGAKAAIQIREILFNYAVDAKIVPILKQLREIKSKGADLVEALQVLTPDQIRDYILNNTAPEKNSSPSVEPLLDYEPEQADKPDAEPRRKWPFKSLGVADDGKAYFLDRTERLQKFNLASLTKTQLMTLAPYCVWSDSFGEGKKPRWDEAVDYIISVSGAKTFDPSMIRGRGAWRSENADLTYHDGLITSGYLDPNVLYLKKAQKDIGLSGEYISKELRTKIKETIFSMSFQTKADAIRTMAWVALAPFGGGLDWRPALFLTGESGSGKSVVATKVIKKLVLPLWMDGTETTPAAIRGATQNDTCAVVLEESECDTKKKKENRASLLSMMRTSTSDESPDVGKGTVDGGFRSYKMRNMFCFVAINPEIDSVADENRLFKINMERATNNWSEVSANINEFITTENCAKLRAYSWSMLSKILEDVNKLLPIVQELTKQAMRYCYAESLLLSAYFNVWGTMYEDPSEIKKELELFYSWQPVVEARDEVDEMLDRLLDQSVAVLGYGDQRTLRTVLYCLKKGKVTGDYGYDKDKEIGILKSVVHRYGLSLIDISAGGGEVIHEHALAISSNNHEIMKIIEKGTGYAQLFGRHKNCVERSRTVYMGGKNRKCVVIGGVFEKEDEI